MSITNAAVLLSTTHFLPSVSKSVIFCTIHPWHYKQVASFPFFVAFVYRTLSAVRYRIHLNLCIALAAAQLVFIAGIEATDIKVRIAHFIILIAVFLVLEIIRKLQIPSVMEKCVRLYVV